MPNGKLSGKVALVTGSSRGIGKAMSDDKPLRIYALRLGQDGANVVVTYAGNKDKAEEVVATIEANGAKAIAIQLDMRNLDDVRNLFQKTLDHFCLAKELGARGITVNTIAPGVTATDGLVLEQAQVDQMISQTPLGRLGQPTDVADAMPQGGLPVKARLNCVGGCPMDYRTAYSRKWRHCLATGLFRDCGEGEYQ